jgi:oxygen-independent coproporphyrinogen III oxidase
MIKRKRKKKMTLQRLIRKYDVPVPRYTSYPTVPSWDIQKFSIGGWWNAVEKCFAESNKSKGISLYIHLPFCESLCTYCACNTRITKNHSVEEKYVKSVLQEWALYKKHFDGIPVIREIHLGGGTPTFFNTGNLSRLIQGILEGSEVHPGHEFSFEGHPNNTTAEHLQTLFDLGFRRVSFGVQDLDLKVQQAVNRVQPFENLQRVVEQSRNIGYHSVSFDLIYGLPYQTLGTVRDTVNKVITLQADRIAFYSYAHVPWMKPGQRGYEDADLPTDVVKRSLYETGRELFHAHGYVDIGMDHFSLPHDSLYIALKEGMLHRNFMGYTTNQTDLLVGLGVSSISDAKYAYAQNLKKVEDYQEEIYQQNTAIFKGHLQDEEDLIHRRAILDIACKGKLDAELLAQIKNRNVEQELSVFEDEDLIELNADGLQVTETGRIFIRNICSVFDKRVKEGMGAKGPVFSKAI